ncbi:MAG: hypothetical protein A2236_06750 [Bacteroidetes bacterium RIFOXYA2_FULL_33_7]|nr:MAG: hypothetical protein A2236_06750 [Bacteroidetes bacterium RIFOXYA2_FULL_33_7]
MFSDFFDHAYTNVLANSQLKPLSNIYETKEYYKIEMAIPGIKKEDVVINLEKNILSISRTSEDLNDENILYERREFKYNNFERLYTLPKSADLEKINASFNNGILEIVIYKKEEAKDKPAREIKIS